MELGIGNLEFGIGNLASSVEQADFSEISFLADRADYYSKFHIDRDAADFSM